MKRCRIALLTAAGFVLFAQAADLPAQKAPEPSKIPPN
jgi:hypothetical protein